MERTGARGRQIRFKSEKNGCVMKALNALQKKYADIIEENEVVESYELNVPLDMELMGSLSRLDIRPEYFVTEWVTDVVLHTKEGILIRELIKEDALKKPANLERLELSRRYWKQKGCLNWMLFIEAGDSDVL